MKNFANKFIDRSQRACWLLIAIIVRSFTKVYPKRIFCISFFGKKYACNPKFITEYILNHDTNFQIYWAFNKNVDTSKLDKRINIVRKYSLSYFCALYTSKYVISNARSYYLDTMFIKKTSQKYIQTWHSSIRLKKIEGDAAEQLGDKYICAAKKDSKMADLMLSNSEMYSEMIRRAFFYNGEILECCMPRNDIYYSNKAQIDAYLRVRDELGIDKCSKIVLYAPTFRNDYSNLSYYKIDWDLVLPHLNSLLGNQVHVLVRLHPNMSEIQGIGELCSYNNVHNITSAPDITDYLFASDLFISDYTSAMFDCIILNKPCIIYATDKDTYDRGFYWSFDQLPFPVAENESQLISEIDDFSFYNYKLSIDFFKSTKWKLREDGHGCERLYRWILNN